MATIKSHLEELSTQIWVARSAMGTFYIEAESVHGSVRMLLDEAEAQKLCAALLEALKPKEKADD
jgi:hypothetical protein